MPAVDWNGCKGSCSLKIEGFVQVYLELNSTGTDIEGCLVAQPNTPNTIGSAGAPNLGPLAPPVLIN
jgi:hypothetical protein